MAGTQYCLVARNANVLYEKVKSVIDLRTIHTCARNVTVIAAIKLNSTIPYATESELVFLAGLEVENVVMLGAGPGVMLLAVRETNRDVESWVIDKDPQALYYTNVHMEGIGLYTHSVEADSAEVAKQFKDNFVDLLIVDADHSYEAVKRDLVEWWPKVKEFGYVFLHDYDADGTEFADKERYPGVKQAVKEFFGERPHKIVTRVGTAIVVGKVSDDS